jgi:hypothetical protein
MVRSFVSIIGAEFSSFILIIASPVIRKTQILFENLFHLSKSLLSWERLSSRDEPMVNGFLIRLNSGSGFQPRSPWVQLSDSRLEAAPTIEKSHKAITQSLPPGEGS